jgi:hypothetical protein
VLIEPTDVWFVRNIAQRNARIADLDLIRDVRGRGESPGRDSKG